MLCYCLYCTYVNKLVLVIIRSRNGVKAIFTIYNQQMHNIFNITLLRHSYVFRCLNASSSSSSSGISFRYAKVTSRDSVVGIVTRLQTGRPRNRGSIPGKGQEIFIFSKTYPQPTQPPIQWVAGAVSRT
jgi:hypothetical protein